MPYVKIIDPATQAEYQMACSAEEATKVRKALLRPGVPEPMASMVVSDGPIEGVEIRPRLDRRGL